MKIDLDFAEFHIPIFLGGINWGQKLFKKQSKGVLKLTYDRAEKEVIIEHGKFVVIVPTASNVAVMAPASAVEEVKKEPAPVIEPQAVIKRGPGRPAITQPNAQVSTPHSHVFAQGPGKTNDR